MKFRQITAVCFLTAACLMFTGCSTIFDARKQKLEIMEKYDAGDYKAAAALIQEKAESRKDTGDSVMWFLDQGTIEFDGGDFKNSLKAFQTAEKQINEYDRRAQISVRDGSAEVGSAITNPNAIPYRGMCRDRVLMNVYKALDYFALGNTEGALVELRRARDAQKNIANEFRQEIESAQKEIDEQNAKNKEQHKKDGISYENLAAGSPELRKIQKDTEAHSNKTYRNFLNPFVSYMSAIGYMIENDYAEAFIDFSRLYLMAAKNPLFQRDLATCARVNGDSFPEALTKIKSWPYPLNQNIVYIIFADGRGAAYKQFKIQLPIPYVGYTGIAFPVVEYFKEPETNLQVIGPDAVKLAEAVTVCNMDSVVAHEYKERMAMMITRLAVSYLTKELAAQAILIAARHGGGSAGLIAAYAGTSVYKFLFNTADTRCWETIPKRYMIAHFPIPVTRKVTINIDAAKYVKSPKKGTNKKNGNSSTTVVSMPSTSFELSFPQPANFFIAYIRRARNGKVTARVFPVLK